MSKRLGPDYYDADYFLVKGCKGLYTKEWFTLDNQFHNEMAKIIMDVLQTKPNNGRLIELGCAFGNVLHWLEQNNIMSFGVDISEYAIENSYMPQRTKQADIIDGIPFPDESFQYLFTRETLEHIDEEYVPRVIKEIYRVMAKGGACLISARNNWYDKETQKHNDPVAHDDSHLCIKTPGWWALRLKEVGFNIDYERSLYAMGLELCEKYAWTMIVARKDK